MGDGHAVVAEGHAEGGVAAGVDQADADPVAGPGGEGLRVLGHPTVDEVVRVGDVAGVAAEDVAGGAHEHAGGTGRLSCGGRRHGAVAHVAMVHTVMVHTAVVRLSVVHAAHPAGEFREHRVRRAAVDPVDPVVQDDDPLLVVGQRLLRVLHDQRRVQSPVLLGPRVRVQPVRTGVRDGEAVVERRPCRDAARGQARDAVHVVAQGEPVPVHGRRYGQVVGEGERERVAGGDAELLAGQRVAVGPGRDRAAAAQVQAYGGGGQRGLPYGPGAAPGLGGGDFLAAGGDVAAVLVRRLG